MEYLFVFVLSRWRENWSLESCLFDFMFLFFFVCNELEILEGCGLVVMEFGKVLLEEFN